MRFECLFQIYACIITFFLCNTIEAQLLSTGAFEVTLNGKHVFLLASFVGERP